jgi:hypothetical protein
MSLYNDASLLLIPSGYKSGKVYCQKPTDGDGDLTFTRASSATRVNSDGLIESVATGVPRLDYSQGSCPALLLEPQRTNLLLYSEEFDNAYWSKANLNISGTPSWINALLSPDGTQNAEILIPNNTTNAHQFAKTDVGYVADTNFTFSCFLKENGFRYAALNVALRIGGTFQENASGLIDLQSKTITIITSNIIFRDVKVQNLGDFQNGFTRYSISVKTPISGSDRLDVNIRCVDSSGASILGDNVGGFGVWGAQFEVGSNATSYIPTTTTAVTRVADVASKTGISDLIGQTEGTLFVDYNRAKIADSSGILELGEVNNEIAIWQNAPFQLRFFIRVNGSVFGSRTFNFSDERLKIALTYQTDSYSVFLNGVKILENIDITSLSNSYNGFILGNRFTNPAFSAINSGINLTALWKTQLTDQECINLTTL